VHHDACGHASVSKIGSRITREHGNFDIDPNGEKYLLWYMRAKSTTRVFKVSQKLKHPIDTFHYHLMAEITAANIFAVPLIDIPRG
jgi:hypothetical protein